MREIKFKGKDIDSNKWRYGSIVKTRETDGTLLYYIVDEENQQWNVFPKTVCQYTGMKDMKDIDIYEGDITRRRWLRGEEFRYAEEIIHFDNGAFWCILKGGGCGELLGSHLTRVIPSQIEVIGTIHDTEIS